MMDCNHYRERLPWLLNGTLEPQEEEALRAHLADCDACAETLRETRIAWSLHEGHLPSEALVAYSLEDPLPAPQRRWVESHLAACAQCTEELTLLRAEAEDTPRLQGEGNSNATVARLRALAAAACLAAVVCGLGWYLTAQKLRTEPAPRINTPILELIPATPGTVARSALTEAEGLINPWEPYDLPGEAEEVVLTLLSGELQCPEGCTVEILRADGTTVWTGKGLRATAAGHATLTLPRRLLPAGSWTVLLSESDRPDEVVRYLIAAP